jgi:hypothetical protein
MGTSNKISGQQMSSNGKIIKNKVVELIDNYNFYFSHFSIGLCLKNSNFEFQSLKKKRLVLQMCPRPQLSDASLEHASHLLSVTRVIEKCHGYAFLSVTRLAKTRHMPYL